MPCWWATAGLRRSSWRADPGEARAASRSGRAVLDLRRRDAGAGPGWCTCARSNSGRAQPAFRGRPHVKVFQAKGGDLMVHMTGIVAALVLGLVRASPDALGDRGVQLRHHHGQQPRRHGRLRARSRPGVANASPGAGRRPVRLRVHPARRAGRASSGRWSRCRCRTARANCPSSRWSRTSRVCSGAPPTPSTAPRGGACCGGRDRQLHRARPLLLTGKGFGVNLAVSDGFRSGRGQDDGLRSPHNGHMTVLARGGVPALAAVDRAPPGVVCCRRLGAGSAPVGPPSTLGGVSPGSLASGSPRCRVNASFDVFIEGPMGGIWLWTVIGVGIAAVRLHARTLTCSRPRLPLPDHDTNPSRDARPAAAFSWS